jgi:hypothetical protein
VALVLRARRPTVAGSTLAVAALLKPHWTIAIGLLWIAYHVRHSRQRDSRRFLAGAAVTTAALVIAATFLHPTWRSNFNAAAYQYTQVDALGTTSSAVYVLLQFVVAEPLARSLAVVATLALFAWALAAWFGPDPQRPGVIRSLVASALVVPPAWETGAIVLLIPLAVALGGLSPRARPLLVLASVTLTAALSPLPLILPWRSGAIVIAAYAALWAIATHFESTSVLGSGSSALPAPWDVKNFAGAPEAGAASPPHPATPVAL